MNEFLQKLIKSFFSKNNVYYLYLRLDFIMENVKLFEKNLNAIKSYDIDLYNQLVSLPSNDGALSLAYTKQNEPNLLYKNYPLHSPNGAIDEATNIIKSLNVNENNLNTFIVFGLGFGYLLDELHTKYCDSPIIVYEPNVQILRTVLETVDFQNTLNAYNVRIATNINMFRNHMLNLCSSQSNLKVAYLESYKQLYTNEMLDFVNQAHTTYKILKFNLNFLANSSMSFFSQIIEHLDKKIHLPEFGKLENKLKNKPAIIVSGGPSLSKNIDTIKKYRDKVCIFAVGTAYKTLKRNGITPDFVNIIELNNCSEQILNEDIENINFISEVYTNKVFFEKPFKRHFITYSRENPSNIWFEKLISNNSNEKKYETKGTVAYNALFCAKMAGCNPIILIGQDLAYTSGKLYADSSPYCEFKCKYNENTRKYSVYINDYEKLKKDLFDGKNETEEHKKKYIDYKLDELNRRIITVKGQSGKDLPSDFGFGIFIEYFQDFAFRYGKDKNLKLYNASTGGSQINGFENVALEDVLEHFDNSFCVDEILNNIDLSVKIDENKVYEKIKKEIEILNQVKNDLLDSQKAYLHYKNEINHSKTLTSNAAKNLKKVLDVVDNIYTTISSKNTIVLLTCIKHTQKLNDLFRYLENEQLDYNSQKMIIKIMDSLYKGLLTNIEKVVEKLKTYI